VGGVIAVDTTWDQVSSPYLVTGNILVEPGVTLSITPGTEVQFDAGNDYYIRVDGTMKAIGTQAEPILFTSNATTKAPGDWGYISFENGSSTVTDQFGTYIDGNILEYCTLEYAGGDASYRYAVLLDTDSDLYINYSLITLSVGGIYISENNTSSINYIRNTEISDCENYSGIQLKSGNNYITNCVIRDNIYGIFIMRNSYTVVRNNLIDSNINDGIRFSGAYSSIDQDIQYNTITNNNINDNSSYGAINYHYLSDDIDFYCWKISFNSMYDNYYDILMGKDIYKIYSCKYNYWGSPTTIEMNAEGASSNISAVYDYYDDFDRPKALYDNWLPSEPDYVGIRPENLQPLDSSIVDAPATAGPSTSITLTLTTPEPSNTEMRISNNHDFSTGTGWIDFATSYPWTMSPRHATHASVNYDWAEVFVQFRHKDNTSEVSVPLYDIIEYMP
jgi:parallel beta-helix repeat protein